MLYCVILILLPATGKESVVTKKYQARKPVKSKVTKPKGGARETLQAFRADKELSKLLGSVPNKSETIVTALREHFAKTHYVTCPTCQGRGKIRKG